MISMLVASPFDEEAGRLCVYARDVNAGMGDEKLAIYRCRWLQAAEEEPAFQEKMDLICIDITIPGALELAESLRSAHKESYMILIASMQISPVSYMKPSVRAEALILKPFKEEQVRSAFREVFQELLKQYSEPDIKKVFVIDNQEGRVLIAYGAICFFEARNKKIYLNTGTKEYGFYSTLEKLEEELDSRFLRCHRGFLVNQGKIGRIVLSRNRIVLDNGFEIPVSRSYREAVKKAGEQGKGGAKG